MSLSSSPPRVNVRSRIYILIQCWLHARSWRERREVVQLTRNCLGKGICVNRVHETKAAGREREEGKFILYRSSENTSFFTHVHVPLLFFSFSRLFLSTYILPQTCYKWVGKTKNRSKPGRGQRGERERVKKEILFLVLFCRLCSCTHFSFTLSTMCAP